MRLIKAIEDETCTETQFWKFHKHLYLSWYFHFPAKVSGGPLWPNVREGPDFGGLEQDR